MPCNECQFDGTCGFCNRKTPPTPISKRWSGPVRASVPAQDLIDVAIAHHHKANEYERGGNATGAKYLRAVENLIWAIVRGGSPPTTILP